MKERFIKKRVLLRFLILELGFFVMASGLVMMEKAVLGVNSWNVLHLGISYNTSLSWGQAIWVVSSILVIINWINKETPRAGTFLEMFMVGLFVDLINMVGAFSYQSQILWQYFYNISGVVLLGMGITIYNKMNFGAGPRDGLMLVLQRRFKMSIGLTRTLIEVIILALGYVSGGPVGIGTVIVTFGVGWVIDGGFRLWAFLEQKLQSAKPAVVE